MVDNPFSTPYEDLTDEQREMLELARQVLEKGDMLYGEDLSHVNWVLSQAVYLLEQHAPGSLYFELSLTDAGYGIGIIQP